MNKTKKQLEKELFDMVYSWGKYNIIANENSPSFIEKLDQLTEIKYKEELKVADNRWKRAEDKLKKYTNN